MDTHTQHPRAGVLPPEVFAALRQQTDQLERAIAPIRAQAAALDAALEPHRRSVQLLQTIGRELAIRMPEVP